MAGEADADHLVGRDARLGEHLEDGGLDAAPPVGRVLLGPERLGGRDRVVDDRGADDLARLARDEQGLVPGCADVNT